VLFGRTTADMVRNIFVVLLMVGVGFAVGFRIHSSVLSFIGGLALVVLFGYAISWVFAVVGLLVKDPETAQAAAFPVLAPLVFASTAFVRAESMEGFLQPFARNQPVSATVGAVRDTVLGTFWPETDQSRARAALRSALYTLRQHLPDRVIRSRGDDDLSIDPELLRDVGASSPAAGGVSR